MGNGIMIINNTGSDIRMFDDVFYDCFVNNKPLPEEISDIFQLIVFTVNGHTRCRIEFV